MPYDCKNWVPHITVATIVEQDGLFLCVEEHSKSSQAIVINQPAGHVERGESILRAAVRETLEETGYLVEPEHLVAVQRWHKPNSDHTYFRIVVSAKVLSHDAERELDAGIVQALWLSRDELTRRTIQLRSPLVSQTVDDYLAGERHSLSILKDFE